MPLIDSESRRQFSLRSARSEDAEHIAFLGADIFSTTFGYSMPAPDLEEYLRESYSVTSIAMDITDPNVDLVVAVNEKDHVIGFSQLRRGTIEKCISNCERPIELQRLYVGPEYHGHGIARALVGRSEKVAEEQRFKTMWLGVWEENFNAQRVYERLGFERVGEHDFKMGSCVQTDWIMSKKL